MASEWLKKKAQEQSGATTQTAGGSKASSWLRNKAKEQTREQPAAPSVAGYNDSDADIGWSRFQADQKERKDKSWFAERIAGNFGNNPDAPPIVTGFAQLVNSYRDDTSYREPSDSWSDLQKKEFGYLYGRSQDEAWRYAEQVNNNIARAETEKQKTAITESATDGFWKGAAHTAGALATAPTGLADYLDNMAEFAGRGRVTEKAGVTPFDYSQTVTGGIAQNLNEKYGTLNEEIPVIGGKGLGDVYGIGTSIAQSALAGYTGGRFGTLVQFFGSAAAAGVDNAKQRGATDEQALAIGTLEGVAEGLAEMIGVDNLLKIGSASTMRGLLKNLLKQGAAEGIEEGITTLMNNFADQMVMQDKSNFNLMVQALVSQGMSEEEAKKQAWLSMVNDLAFDMVAGFVSGAAHAGPQTAAQTVIENVYQPYRTGKTIMESEGAVDALKQLAEEVAGASSADMHRDISEQIGKADGGSAIQVGKLYDTVQTANNLVNASANQADIAKSLERKGFDSQKAKAVAEALVARYNGQTLTKEQEKTLKAVKGNKDVQAAITNIMDNAKSTMGQRSENLRSFNREVVLGRLAKEQKNLSAPEENGSQSHYEVSVDGKTLDGDGNVVTIRGISSVENGKVVLQTEDGTVDADSVSYGSRGEAQVYEAVSRLEGIIDTETANKLSRHLLKLGDVTTDTYANAIQQAYTYGYYGYGRDAMMGEDTLSATLTEKQRNVAYGMGEQYRAAKTAVEDALVRKTRSNQKPQTSGKVHFDGDRSALTERQSASLSAMETVAEALGVQIHVFESQVDKDGRHIGANGWYDPKDGSIHIDLHAGATGEGTMLFTAAHELTHFIRQWSPAKFKVLADFLMQEYGQKGVSVDALVREQMAKAERNGRTIDYDTAYEEVVADSMETMLSDGKVTEKLAKLKQVDKTLWQKIKDFISDLAAKIRQVYEGMTPDSVEGRYVAEMVDSIEKLQDLFTEGLAEAGENYQSSLTPGQEGTVVNQKGDPVAHATADGSVLLSMRTYEEDGRKAFRNYLNKCVKNRKLTKAEMQEMLDGIEEIYGICKDFKDKFAPFSAWSDASVVRDTRGRPVFSVVTPNGDYKMNLDFSLVCKKRRTLDAVFNEMSRRGIIDDFELGQKSVVKINEIIRKYDLETACALCFVDAKRFRQASMADSFTGLYNELVESLIPEDQKGSIDHFNFSGYSTIKKVANGIHTWDASKLDFSHIDHVLKTYGDGTVEYKAAKYIKSHPDGRKLLLRGDFMSSQGFDAVKTQNPDVLKLYNSKKGTGGPKAAFGDVQYLNEIIQKARWWTPAKAYEVGGVRIQSFSDYVPRMVFDYVQMIYDLAATKLPAHAYSKEALFVKQFGLTGIKINMSLIPAIAEGGIAPGLDADGNYVWAGESFDFETAKQIQNAEGYTENCGTICVGVSRKHIEKLLDDPDIRMVIPYHKSGLNPIVAHMNKIAEFEDYTNKQNTTVKETGSKAEENFDFNKALHDMGENADPRAVIRQYFDWCDARGYDPKFAEFRYHPNYYKLIEDFTLYDRDGNYVPQREVKAVFPKADSAFGSMKDLIKEGLEEDAVIEGKRDSRLSAIVDEIQNTLPRTEAEISEEQVEQADRDLEAEVKYSFRGINQDGIEVYETSEEIKKLPYTERQKRFLNIMENDYRGRTAKFIRNGHAYYATFDEKDVNKNIYGDKLSDKRGWKAKINVGADGDIFELVENARYNGSLPEKGKKNTAHRGVVYWDYFIKNVQIDGTVFDLVANVRKKADGAFVYSIQLKENKKIKASPPRGSLLRALNGVTNASTNTVTQPTPAVKKYSDRDSRTYAEIEEERQALRQREMMLEERKRKAVNDPELLQAMDAYSGLFTEMRELFSKKRNGTATQAELDRIEEIKRLREESMKRVTDLQESLGLNAIAQEETEIREIKEALRIASDTAWAREGAEKENKAIEKAGVSAPEYFRKKALKAFKTTTNFNEAGYLLPDGKLLNFSGGERNHRYRDHREIGEIYEATQGAAALNRFMSDGNIRIMAESPGVDITSGIEPTNEQYAALRKFVNSHGVKERKFFVDFSDADGHRAGNYSYEGRVNADRVINDIKHYYATGEIREQSSVAQFLWSDRDTESVSNRSLLANAFESVAQNDIERKKLQEYKGKIDQINAEERKLRELNAQIKELSFAKGKRDTQKIRELRDEAQKTANRITIVDKQLLRLEASKPLRNVLDREYEKAYRKAEQKGKEALAEYKRKVDAEQREAAKQYRESRNKAVAKAKESAEKRESKLREQYRESKRMAAENREKTAMRHKIQNVVKELNDLLLNESKKRHVPDSLKKAVAAALDLVNMDTTGAEERASRYAALIAKEQAKANPDQDKIDAYTVSMENILRQGDKMGQRLKELREAYDEIQESTDPDIANAYDPVIAGCLKELSGTIGDTSLRDMSIEQLSDVYDMYRMVLTRVRDANKAMSESIRENIEDLAKKVTGEVRMTGGEHKFRVSALDPVRKFLWNNLKPVYAMEHIGSSTLTKVFGNVRAGEDTWAKDVTEARGFYLDKARKHGYDSWDFKKKYRFENEAGQAFELTLEQILSLYAYSKREQAFDHLRLGGFVFDSNIETYRDEKSKVLKYKVNTADAHQITPEILADIIGNLTGEQTAFVDEMQEYLSSVMGAKGNEVTMKMYGVKLFKEKFYFPLKSAKQFMFEQNEVSGEVKIKNSGFTNKVVAKANNPVILGNFMDVWSGHVNDMSMYHAFVLPLEDFNRVFNYNSPKQENQPPVSVKGTIQNAYSPAAVEYVKNLITDLNGGARTDSTTGVINKMMGLFKKGAVFASLSVVFQQPSAVARAAAIVDTKYFIGPKVDSKRHKLLWAEVKKYAPVAIIKEMGYFDTNMGKSTQDFIQGKEYSGFKEKMKALVTDGGYRDEILSKAPALADELAWCSIWEAVKRETKAKHPGMDARSEAFLQMAGKRFTEVITKTQVYDSVLARSANMRSKDTGMKMATSFMAEPTTSINMIADALLQGKRGNRKYCRTAIGAVIASQILNSILVSFVYAGRDDDEDETYWEKYIGTLSGEILDSLNPAGYIPFIKDIVSIVQGYDVERSDMAVISDLWNAWQKLGSDKLSTYRKVEGFAGSIAQIFGLPLKNIMRDVRAIWQTLFQPVIDRYNGTERETITAAGIGYAVKSTAPKWLGGGDVSNQDQLYKSIVNGDEVHAARVKGRFKDESAVRSAIRSALREHDPRIREAAIAWNANDLDEYMRIAKQIIGEKHFIQDDVVMAIRTEASKLEPDAESTTASKAKGLFTAEKFAEAIAQNDSAMAYSIMTDIVKTSQKNGDTASDAKKSFGSSASSACKKLFLTGGMTVKQAENALVDYCGLDLAAAKKRVGEWKFEYDYGYSYDDRVEAYKKGVISAYEMKTILMTVGGRTADEAYNDIRAYDWMKNHPSYDISVSDVLAYTKTIEDIGVSVEESGIEPNLFVEYRTRRSKCKGVDEDRDGTADRNSVKNEVLEVINNMPITSEQKDVLYYLNGWAKSNLHKAPWH